ncbi:BrxA/BrxB family bacilliredoxin [Streptomyces anulatus]
MRAASRMRGHFSDIPWPEPSFALFQDSELIYFLPRHHVEGRDPNAVASDLRAAFDEFAQ